MRRSGAALAGFLAVRALVPVGALSAQAIGVAATTKVIDVYRGAPVKDALDILRQRYHLAITYESPLYACACDLADMTSPRRTPGAKVTVLKLRQLHFEYAELNGEPQEAVTSLIRRLLGEHAAQGGPVFDVRERTTPQGTEWNVVPLKARGSSGALVDQPDILGTLIFIPKARRSEGEFLNEMLQQLRTETGYRVDLGTVQTRIDLGTAELSADNLPAREVLVGLFGTSMVWDLNYDPTSAGRYVLNLVWTPKLPQPLNAYVTARTPEPQSDKPAYIPAGAVLHRMTFRPEKIKLQSKLAQGGYYDGEPNGEWDAKTINAVRKFQAANKIPVTGTLDPETIHTLGLDVVTPKSK
jgi:hypothetical protein